MEDLRNVAARLWDLAGRRAQPRSELVRLLAEQLHWFKPSRAEEVVDAILASGLWSPGPTAGTWVAGPTVERREIALAYRPPESFDPARELAARDLPTQILEELSARCGVAAEVLRGEAQRDAQSLGVELSVAALLVARRHGWDPQELRRQVAERLLGPAGTPAAGL